MTTTVLAYFPSPGQGVWYLGPFPIRAYALCIIAGIIAALVIGDRRWVARGGEPGVVYDVALWAVPFGLIGGRLYHLLTDWKTYFGPGGAGIAAAARIWEGGLGIWGAVFLGGVGAWIACRRRGIPLPAFGDAVAPGIVLAQAIGRLGNYFNQELYGRETTVPWGMEVFYRRDSSGMVDVHSLDGVSTGQVAAVVHPTFLYELLWNLLVFVFLLWADRKFRLGHGRLFALYVASYCVGRFWVELMRDDTATHIAGIRVNVFTATFVFIGAVVYMLLAPKGRENPADLRGHEPEPLHDELEAEESKVEEWAEDLVTVATGGGILAAAKVAGEHEDEDAQAVGDTEAEHTDTEVIDTRVIETEEDRADTEIIDTKVAETEVTETEVTEQAEVDEAGTEEDRADTEIIDTKVTETEVTDTKVTEAEVTETEVTETEVTEQAEVDEAKTEVDEAETEEDRADTEIIDIKVTEAKVTEAGAEGEAGTEAARPDEIDIEEVDVEDVEAEDLETSSADDDEVNEEADETEDEAAEETVDEHAESADSSDADLADDLEETESVAAEESESGDEEEEVEVEEASAEPEPEPEPEAAPKPKPEPEPEAKPEAKDEPVKLKGSTLRRLLWGTGRN